MIRRIRKFCQHPELLPCQRTLQIICYISIYWVISHWSDNYIVIMFLTQSAIDYKIQPLFCHICKLKYRYCKLPYTSSSHSTASYNHPQDNLLISATAILSHLSFSGCPAWPCTQTNFTVCRSSSASSSSHKSTLSAGAPSDLCQPFLFQLLTHPLVTESTKYFESLVRVTSHGTFNFCRARIAAVSSIRLFVVSFSPPLSSISMSLNRMIAPHPPGPGFPEQAPSVNIST